MISVHQKHDAKVRAECGLSRKTRRYQFMRSLLFFALGGRRCRRCGSEDKPSFDVIVPTPEPDSHHAGMSSAQRITFYWRQMLAGNLQVLCDKCNSSKGDSAVSYV
jgi:hypothetical protein